MRLIDADLLLAVVETGRCNIPIPDNDGALRKYLDWVKTRFDAWLSDNKDAIIDCAGKYLAEKLSRTKAARELLKGE